MLLNVKVSFKDAYFSKRNGYTGRLSFLGTFRNSREGEGAYWKPEYGPENSFQMFVVVYTCACWSVSYFNWNVYTAKAPFEVKKCVRI